MVTRDHDHKAWFLRVRDDDEHDPYFPGGSYVKVLADCGLAGVIVLGMRRCQSPHEHHVIGEYYEDEKLCAWDEFDDG